MAINMISVSALTLVAITTLGNFVHVSNGHASQEIRLIHDITSRAHHHSHRLARPLKDVRKAVQVDFGLSIVQLLDFDSKNQVITLSVWKHYKWYDELQAWNASAYGNITKVVLPMEVLWTPDIVLYNNIERQDSEHHTEKIIMWNDGRIEWIPYVVYRSSCQVDMKDFPFDEQNCTLKFGSWSYADSELNLDFLDGREAARFEHYTDNIEWTMQSSGAKRSSIEYPCCPGDVYVDITFFLHIKRQWGIYFKCMLLPTILLSAGMLLIFWIPPTRPDRTGLGTSLLGSFMLLLILVTQISPPSETIKFVSYICSNMVLTFLATLFSAFMVNLSNKTTKLPYLTRKVFLGRLGWLLGVVSLRTNNQQKQEEPANNGAAEEKHSVLIKGMSPRGNQREWQLVVAACDRIGFLVFFIMMVICVIEYFPRPKDLYLLPRA